MSYLNSSNKRMASKRCHEDDFEETQYVKNNNQIGDDVVESLMILVNDMLEVLTLENYDDVPKYDEECSYSSGGGHPWLNFVDIEYDNLASTEGVQSLQGTMHQGEPTFGESAGKQCTCIVAVFITYIAATDPADWDSVAIDKMLKRGTQKYEHLPSNKIGANGYVSVEDSMGTFRLTRPKTKVELKEGRVFYSVFDGALIADDEYTDMEQMICAAIETVEYGIIVSNNFSLGIAVRDDFVFLFNSHATDEMGLRKWNGVATLLKISRRDAAYIISYIVNYNYAPKEMKSKNRAKYIIALYEVKCVVEALEDNVESDDDFQKRKKKKFTKCDGRGTETANDPKGGSESVLPVDSPMYILYRIEETAGILDRVGDIDPKRVQVECVTKNQIRNNGLVIYSVKAMESDRDFFWRHDGVGFVYSTTKYYPQTTPKWKVSVYNAYGPKKEVQWQRKEYIRCNIDGETFDWKNRCNWPWPYVLINYVQQVKGAELADVIPSPHKNIKATPLKASHRRLEEIVGETPSATSKISNQERHTIPGHLPKSEVAKLNLMKSLENMNPKQAQAHLNIQSAAGGRRDAISREPRNRKQAYNTKQELNRQNAPSDDLALVDIEAFTHPEYVFDKRTWNGKLYVVTRVPEMDDHINKLLNAGETIVLGYDTTFKCGDFFVSILIARHPYIQGDKIIPIGFLFHGSKEEVGHDMLFNEKVMHIPRLNSSQVTIVTDREEVIKKSIKRYLPSASHYFCFIHMQKNVNIWLSENINKAEHKICLDGVRKLLFCTNEESYNTLLVNLTSDDKWPMAFTNYYMKQLDKDIRQSYKGVSQNSKAFNVTSGITTNPSESANASYKIMLNKAKKPLIVAIQISYLEIVNALHLLRRSTMVSDGDFKVKESFLEKMIPICPDEQKDTIHELGLKSIFEKGEYKEPPVSSYQPKMCYLTSREGYSEFFIKKNRIMIIEGEIFVRGFQRKILHVDPTAKPPCTCMKPSCEHLLAVTKMMKMDKWKQTKPRKFAEQEVSRTRIAKLLTQANVGRKTNEPIRRRIRIQNMANPRTTALLKKIKKAIQLRKNLTDASNNADAALHKEASLGEGLNQHNDPSNEEDPDYDPSHERAPDIGAQNLGQEEQLFDPLEKQREVTRIQQELLEELPILTLQNGSDVVLNVYDLQLRLLDFKLMTNLSPDEQKVQQQLWPALSTNQVSDNIVEALLKKLFSKTQTYVMSCEATRLLLAQQKVKRGRSKSIKKIPGGCRNIILPLNMPEHAGRIIVVSVESDHYLVQIFQTAKGSTTFAQSDIKSLASSLQILLKDNLPWRGPRLFDGVHNNVVRTTALLACLNVAKALLDDVPLFPALDDDHIASFVISYLRDGCSIRTKCFKDNYCILCEEKYPANTSRIKWLQCERCLGWVHVLCVPQADRKASYVCPK